MPKYQISVERKILIHAVVEADSPSEAIQKYKETSVEEEIVDSSDICEPEATLIEDKLK